MRQLRQLAVVAAFAALFAIGPLANAAPPTAKPQRFNDLQVLKDFYFDYEVVAFDTILGGSYYIGVYDTYEQASLVADWLSLYGYEVDITPVYAAPWAAL